MENVILFAVLLALATLYALVQGGAPERAVALGYLAAYVGSAYFAANRTDQYFSLEWGLFAVDSLLAICLVLFALHANRYWTLWAASIQIVSLAAHFAKLVVPELVAPAYGLTLIVWSYLAIPVLFFGTHRHRKRQQRFGEYPGWSLFR
jgi:hypothetical protein